MLPILSPSSLRARTVLAAPGAASTACLTWTSAQGVERYASCCCFDVRAKHSLWCLYTYVLGFYGLFGSRAGRAV